MLFDIKHSTTIPSKHISKEVHKTSLHDCTVCRVVMLPNSVGICISRAFDDRSKISSMARLPNSVGIGPVMGAFVFKSRTLSRVIRPNSVGIVPVKKEGPSLRTSRLASCPNSVDRGPNKRFPPRQISLIDSQLKTPAGSAPLRLLFCSRLRTAVVKRKNLM